MENKWDKEKVQQYINDEIEENSNLDYKAADALGKNDERKKEITKDVSAMANSAGGIIIYGIREYNAHGKKHLPEKLDGIDRILFPKEWLEHIINSIQPRLEGLTIFPVDIDTGQNHVVYVIEIPKSTTAHQAKDYRYYKRFNFESVPMEDYEVRDVMNRSIAPNAQVEFSYIGPKIEGKTHYYTLKIVVKNLGFQVINNFKLKFAFPNYGQYFHYSIHRPGSSDHDGKIYGHLIRPLYDKNNDYVLTYYSYSDIKLFPEDEIEIGQEIKFEYKIDDEAYEQIERISSRRELFLDWSLYADNMMPKHGKISFSKLHVYRNQNS